ncbi:MAG TPA: hypothetical protein VKS81_00335, partial [Bacteroidota bacterium]|nr:hypothetical protein [Bacteroidota bacterium]
MTPLDFLNPICEIAGGEEMHMPTYTAVSLFPKFGGKAMPSCIILAAFLFTSLSFSAEKNPFRFADHRQFTPLKTTVSWSKKILQGIDLQIWLSNQMVMGEEAWDGQVPATPFCVTGIAASFPIGECIEHLWSASPWIGGKIAGVPRVSQGYSAADGEMVFLPVKSDTARDEIWVTSTSDSAFDSTRAGYYKKPMNRRNYDDDGDGKVDEDELDGIDNDGDWIQATDDIGADGVPDSLEVGCKGSYDPVNNPDPAYDDFNPSRYD